MSFRKNEEINRKILFFKRKIQRSNFPDHPLFLRGQKKPSNPDSIGVSGYGLERGVRKLLPKYQDKVYSKLPERRNKARIDTPIRALFAWGFLAVTGSAPPVFLRGPDGDPGSPSRPAPSVQMGAAPHPGPSGPQPPRRPLPPAPTQNGLLYTLLRKLRRGYALQNPAFCASAGACLGLGGPLASAPGGKSGGIPPRTTPPT